MPDGRGGCTWFLRASILEEYDPAMKPFVSAVNKKKRL